MLSYAPLDTFFQPKRHKCSKEIEARFTLLLAGIEKDGSESQGRLLPQVRPLPPFRSPSSTTARPASSVSKGTSRVNCKIKIKQSKVR